LSDHDPSYWARITELLRRVNAPDPVFFDVGANRGEFTERLLEAFPQALVHAVEANPALCGALERRFAGRRVRVHPTALHEREGTIDLQVHAVAGTSWVRPPPRGARRYFHSSDRVVSTLAVPTATLDALAAASGTGRIALLKLDTQGAELPILRGARGLLASGAIDAIYTEFFVVPHYEGAALLHELWAALAAHGYVLYDLFKGPLGRNGQLRFGDALFVSPQVRERVLDAFPEEA
jgi:FkbM family methyltransferase